MAINLHEHWRLAKEGKTAEATPFKEAFDADHPTALYTTVDHPNFMRTTDDAFCARMDQWVSQIEACSFSLSNEQHRVSLFKELKKRVNEASAF